MSERRTVEHTGSIPVHDDAGNRDYVEEFTTFVELRPVTGPTSRARGSREYRMRDGRHVNPKTDGSFVEVDSGHVWMRDDQ